MHSFSFAILLKNWSEILLALSSVAVTVALKLTGLLMEHDISGIYELYFKEEKDSPSDVPFSKTVNIGSLFGRFHCS